MDQINNPISNEEKERIWQKGEIIELHKKLGMQATYYKKKANAALWLIFIVVIAGCLVFAFPNFLVRSDHESDLSRIIKNEEYKTKLEIDSLMSKKYLINGNKYN